PQAATNRNPSPLGGEEGSKRQPRAGGGGADPAGELAGGLGDQDVLPSLVARGHVDQRQVLDPGRGGAAAGGAGRAVAERALGHVGAERGAVGRVVDQQVGALGQGQDVVTRGG